MKSLSSFLKIFCVIGIVVIVLILIGKSFPDQRVVPSLDAQVGYPIPVTVTPVRTSTQIPYPPPGKEEITRSVTPLVFSSSTPIPPPKGWPSDLPWPPIRISASPNPTKTPIIFAKPTFSSSLTIDALSIPQHLWYVYAEDSGSRPILQMERLSSFAQRMGKGAFFFDLNLKQGEPGPSIVDLFPSPNGKLLIVLINFDVTTTPRLIDLDTGKEVKVLPAYMSGQFLGWNPDNQRVYFKSTSNPGQVVEINIVSGKQKIIEFPKNDSSIPAVYAIAFSPDGKNMADALIYPPNRLEKTEYLLSIGIWNTFTQEREVIQEIPLAHSVVLNSLIWTPNGHFLSWIALKKGGAGVGGNTVAELWVSDRLTSQTKVISVFSDNSGGRTAVWSPDSQKIASVMSTQIDNETIGNVFLIDLTNGQKTPISQFQNSLISKVQWSTNSKWVFCNVSDKISGNIWAVNVETGSKMPVAGPVISNSPFTIIP